MFNHDSEDKIQTSWTYDENEGGFIIKATEDIEVGDEICINYGEKTNHDLFLNYGFVMESNEHDVVLFSL